MKLLLDENLPPSLVHVLATAFPDSKHVLHLGFGQTDDVHIYRFAGDNGFTILTKDDDFEFLSVQLGAPPKIVLLKVGNTTVAVLRELLGRHSSRIAEFIQAADDHRILKIGSST